MVRISARAKVGVREGGEKGSPGFVNYDAALVLMGAKEGEAW